MQKIKEIAEFAKLYRINIPVEEHFEYYINTLEKSWEFKDIVSLVDNYYFFENWLKGNNYQNVGHYKMGKVYNRLLDYIKSTEAYKRCLEFDYSDMKFYEKDLLKMHEGNFMLSIDISSANFQSIKVFDARDNELKYTWNELCDYLDIHPMISSSKGFRQVVFGNLNPKRFQKISHYHILSLVEELKENFSEEDIVCVSNDEIIMNLGSEKDTAIIKMEQIMIRLRDIENNWHLKGKTWMDLHFSPFKISKISKGVYVKSILSNSMNEEYKTLFGCPGNIYYMNFKKHILGEEVEERDCLFMLDNKLAKWVV